MMLTGCTDAMHTCNAGVPCDASMHVRTYELTHADTSKTESGSHVRNARDVKRNRSGLEGWESFDWQSLPEGYAGPRRYCHEGWLYVIEFSFGVVKVGQTIAPRPRIQRHVKEAARFGGAVNRFWLCAPSAQWMENESLLILWCFANGRQTFGEYFADLNYAQTVAYADELAARRAANQ